MPSAGVILLIDRHSFVGGPTTSTEAGSIRRAFHKRRGGSMRWSFLPRWKFTDSCGRPQVAGAVHVGCAHDTHICHHASRRDLVKAGGPIFGRAGVATITEPPDL